MSHDPYTEVYKRNIAVGHSDVKTDTLHFQFKGEQFTFPSIKACHVARWTGYFYEAHIDDLRKLEAEAATG